MYRLIAALLITALSNSASAQSSFGLICSDQNEPVPRLLKIRPSEISYFSYTVNGWGKFHISTVDADQISGNLYMQSGITINRLDGTWGSYTDINFKTDINLQSGVCIRKAIEEMDGIASNYLSMLNSNRAF